MLDCVDELVGSKQILSSHSEFGWKNMYFACWLFLFHYPFYYSFYTRVEINWSSEWKCHWKHQWCFVAVVNALHNAKPNNIIQIHCVVENGLNIEIMLVCDILQKKVFMKDLQLMISSHFKVITIYHITHTHTFVICWPWKINKAVKCYGRFSFS